MDDTTQTMFPTDPAPPSDDFDTVAAAKSRAAVAMFTAIEGLANSRKDPEQLHLLAKSYRVMSKVTATDKTTHSFGNDDLDMQESSSSTAEQKRARHLEEALASAIAQCEEHYAALSRVNDALLEVNALLNRAFSEATKQSTVSVLEKDVARAREAFSDESNMVFVNEHAARLAAIRELAALAASAPKLRDELQAANDDVAALREQIKAKPDITSVVRVVAELVAFWRKGDEPYRHAAQVLEGRMMQVAKDAYIEAQNAARRVPAG